VKINECDLGLSSQDLKGLEPVLELVSELKKQGVTGAAVARSFCRRMIQPINNLRTMCGSRTGGWSLPCVMSN
jgi:hypothetical protein